MTTAGGLGMAAARIGSGVLGNVLQCVAQGGVAAAKSEASAMQARHATENPIRDDGDYRSIGEDFHSIAGASD